MDIAKLEIAINEYAKNIATRMLKEYKESLGIEKELYLYQLSTMNFITLNETQKENYTLYIPIPSTITSDDIALSYLKKQIPYELFSLLINPDTKEEKTEIEKYFVKDLTNGLRKKYTTTFCEKYHLPMEKKRMPISCEIASPILEKNIEDINDDKMVFQTNYLYMKQLYTISNNGKNILKEYEETYITPKKMEELSIFLNKYFSNYAVLEQYKIQNSYQYILNDLTMKIIQKYDEKESAQILEELLQICGKEKNNLRSLKKKESSESGHLSIFFLFIVIIIATVVLIVVSFD